MGVGARSALSLVQGEKHVGAEMASRTASTRNRVDAGGARATLLHAHRSRAWRAPVARGRFGGEHDIDSNDAGSEHIARRHRVVSALTDPRKFNPDRLTGRVARSSVLRLT